MFGNRMNHVLSEDVAAFGEGKRPQWESGLGDYHYSNPIYFGVNENRGYIPQCGKVQCAGHARHVGRGGVTKNLVAWYSRLAW